MCSHRPGEINLRRLKDQGGEFMDAEGSGEMILCRLKDQGCETIQDLLEQDSFLSCHEALIETHVITHVITLAYGEISEYDKDTWFCT